MSLRRAAPCYALARRVIGTFLGLVILILAEVLPLHRV